MGQITEISWCDHTFNPWIGCTKISPGCVFCYADALDDKRFSKTLGSATLAKPIRHWGKGAPRHRTSVANWREPLAWNKKPWVCDGCGVSREKATDDCDYCSIPDPQLGFKSPTSHRARVFSASLADVFDLEAPIEWLADLLSLIQKTPNLDWLLLTKRPENFGARLMEVRKTGCREDVLSGIMEIKNNTFTNFGHCVADDWLKGLAPHNVWLGVSVEDQLRGDIRVHDLLKIPAKVRFLSCEPLLGGLDLSKWIGYYPSNENQLCDGRSSHADDCERGAPSGERRGNLATEKAGMGSMEEMRSGSALQSSPSGEQNQLRIFADKSNGGRAESADRGAQDSIQEPRGSDSGRTHNQPQERHQVGQQTGEPGDCNLQRSSETLRPHSSQKSAGSEPERTEESRSDSERQGSGIVERGIYDRQFKPEGTGEKIRSGVPNSFKDSSRGSEINLVIVGGESGPQARPMHPDWARSIRDQCVAAGVAFHFKQWGGVNKKKAGRMLDGREWNEFPKTL